MNDEERQRYEYERAHGAARWRAMGVDAAHEDAEQHGDPCTTIDEARRRIGAWPRGTSATPDDVEAAAQGYLAGWQATTEGGR